MLSLFSGKSAEDIQKKIDKYTGELAELNKPENTDPKKVDKIAEINKKLETAKKDLEEAEKKEEKRKEKEAVKKEAYDKALSDQAAEKEEKAEASRMAEEEQDRIAETNKIKVLGGFFVYRAKPSTESKRIETILQGKGGPDEATSGSQFAQQGEITGMVLIKQSGERKFMTYAPIDSKTYTVDKFMEYFKDTMFNNKYDDSVEKVFEMDALGTLVNKLFVQTVEKVDEVKPEADVPT